ncbi:MAG: hypothetical protein C0517_01180 [Erythrobacter sp.]|nr:hypothetical protein [Erythrobacter sp.]
MTFVSYSQNYEDVRLWRAFCDIEAGRYIDVGGQDPIRDSVSLAFYQRGWRGLHVEPTPAYAAALRNGRPDEVVIEAAIATAPGPIRFFEIPTSGLSTGIADIAQRHSDAGWLCQEILVPTVTLAGVFESFGPEPIHWLKIDVEGMEADVIASWGDHPARPAVLVIEATAPNTQTPTHTAWHAMVLARGYHDVAFDGLSRFFVHESHEHLRDRIAECPNVFDGFQVSDTHFSAGQVRAEKDEAIAEVRTELLARIDAREAADNAEKARLASECEEAQNQLSENEVALGKAKQQLADATAALDALRQDHGKVLREVGHLQGQLVTMAQAHTERFADAAVLREHIERQLERAEEELRTARSDASADRALHSAALSNAKGEIAKLAGVQAILAQQLAEATAQRDSLAENLASSQRKTADQHGRLQAEIDRLNDHIAWREEQLRRATELLVASPDFFVKLPRVRATLVRWLAPRAALVALAEHATAIRQFQREAVVPTAPLPDRGGNLSHPGNPPVADAAFKYGNFEMIESDEPITSVPRLLAPHDREFIHAAYQSVLGRAPDHEGEVYYLNRLRAGAHKLAILRQLRRSPEGRAFIPGVAGLDRAIKRHRWATLPLVGVLVRLITGAEGNRATHRHLRVLANEIGRMEGGQAELARAVRQIAEHSEVIAERTTAPPTEPPVAAPAAPVEPAVATPPRLDAGHMSENLDSAERRLLSEARLFALTHGAPA